MQSSMLWFALSHLRCVDCAYSPYHFFDVILSPIVWCTLVLTCEYSSPSRFTFQVVVVSDDEDLGGTDVHFTLHEITGVSEMLFGYIFRPTRRPRGTSLVGLLFLLCAGCVCVCVFFTKLFCSFLISF